MVKGGFVSVFLSEFGSSSLTQNNDVSSVLNALVVLCIEVVFRGRKTTCKWLKTDSVFVFRTNVIYDSYGACVIAVWVDSGFSLINLLCFVTYLLVVFYVVIGGWFLD